jgi:hypothetical protein
MGPEIDRPIWSDPPPGPKGTIIVIGLSGNPSGLGGISAFTNSGAALTTAPKIIVPVIFLKKFNIYFTPIFNFFYTLRFGFY